MSAQPTTTPTADAALVSGEAVELDVRVARAGSRVVALLLDLLIQAASLLILIPIVLTVAGLAGSYADAALFQGLVLTSVLFVLIGYPLLFETLTGGRTPGKFALGLRVVRDDGGPIRFRHALTRSLIAVAVEFPGLVLPLLTWVVCLVMMLAHPRGKRLGDLAAGTIVIHERTPASWGWVPGMPPPLARWAATLDLTGLDDDLALAIRHFLARGHGLAEPERSRLGYALSVEIAAATTPPPPPGAPGWAYLAAVLAERHHRAARRLARARAASDRLWPDLSRPVRAMPAHPSTDLAPWETPVVPGGHLGAPGQPPHDWPDRAWPQPPWRAPGPDGADQDWTGLRPPKVASAMRPPAPRAD